MCHCADFQAIPHQEALTFISILLYPSIPSCSLLQTYWADIFEGETGFCAHVQDICSYTLSNIQLEVRLCLLNIVLEIRLWTWTFSTVNNVMLQSCEFSFRCVLLTWIFSVLQWDQSCEGTTENCTVRTWSISLSINNDFLTVFSKGKLFISFVDISFWYLLFLIKNFLHFKAYQIKTLFESGLFLYTCRKLWSSIHKNWNLVLKRRKFWHS